MKLALAGISHRTAPVEMREKLAFRAEDIPAALLDMQARGAKEALILSTCNRVEVTAALADDVPRRPLLEGIVAGRDGLTVEGIRPHFYLFEEADAIRHLFRVAASLDSMIVGEPQILGQLKEAYAQAREQGTIGNAAGCGADARLQRGQAHSFGDRDRAERRFRQLCRGRTGAGDLRVAA